MGTLPNTTSALIHFGVGLGVDLVGGVTATCAFRFAEFRFVGLVFLLIDKRSKTTKSNSPRPTFHKIKNNDGGYLVRLKKLIRVCILALLYTHGASPYILMKRSSINNAMLPKPYSSRLRLRSLRIFQIRCPADSLLG